MLRKVKRGSYSFLQIFLIHSFILISRVGYTVIASQFHSRVGNCPTHARRNLQIFTSFKVQISLIHVSHRRHYQCRVNSRINSEIKVILENRQKLLLSFTPPLSRYNPARTPPSPRFPCSTADHSRGDS